MRYKQNLAEYIAIADAARVIQERTGISEDEAKEDIVSALQDYAVQFRLWNVRNDGRHLRSDDYGHVIRQLSPEQIDWNRSLARGGSFDIPYTIEIEVFRDDFENLWPDSLVSEKPDTANNRVVTVRSENLCREWLEGLMADDSAPDRPKRDYHSEAKEKFGVGAKAFQRAWNNAVAATENTNWSRPGPRS